MDISASSITIVSLSGMVERLSHDFLRFLVVASGFALTKADLFPPVAARGAGQIMLVRLSSKLWAHLNHRQSTEHRPSMPHVLTHRACIHVRQHLRAWYIPTPVPSRYILTCCTF